MVFIQSGVGGDQPSAGLRRLKKTTFAGNFPSETAWVTPVGDDFLVVNLHSTAAQRPGFAGHGIDDFGCSKPVRVLQNTTW